MLYKVMIVDDEPLIREGLATLIEWQEYGFEVIQTAKDGHDALVKYEQYKPDLLIVDIRMPGMDGLQLIETIRSRNWTPKLLILSGYADFDYAKKAIKSRVEGYILKPVDEEELIEYLMNIKQSLDRDYEEAKHVGQSWERQREVLIQSVVTGSGTIKGSLSSHASEYGLVWKHYQILLVTFQFEEERQVEVLASARKLLEEWAEKTGFGIVFMSDLQIGVLLSHPYTTNAHLEKLYAELQDIWQELDYKFYAAVGRTVYRFVDIKESYDEALELIKRKFFVEHDRVLSIETAPELKQMIQESDADAKLEVEELADKLYYALDVASMERISAILKLIQAEMIRCDLSEQSAKTACMQMITSALGRLFQHHESLRTPQQDAAAWIVSIYQHVSMREMFEEIESRLFELVQHMDSFSSDTLVKRMIDLIHRNYHENLKLESLAEVFNYNSAYLGKLFKTHTGEYFNTYLDKVRIDNAKQLLESGLKVYQVAERVGYTNVDYFHSKFKKYTGLSPSAYRNQSSAQG